MKFLGDHEEGTKLRVKFFTYADGAWEEPQESWLKENCGKELEGAVELLGGSAYFRPNNCDIVLLHEDEVEILGLSEQNNDTSTKGEHNGSFRGLGSD